MASSNRKILLLIDMNGTMCYRSFKRVEGANQMMRMQGRYWYKRDGVREFVRRLSASEHFHLCVYTSMMAKNALPGLKRLLEDDYELIEEFFDREYNSIDPDGGKSWDTIRDMSKVWPKLGGAYDHTNTILLDNEARKFRDTPDNGIEVPEYGERHVRAQASNTLDAVLVYLLALGEASPSDVREYMRANPFSSANLRAPVSIEVTDLTLKLDTLRVRSALDGLPRSGTACIRCIEGQSVTFYDDANKVTLRVTMRDGLRLDANMNIGRLIELAGEKSIELVTDDKYNQGDTN